MSAALLADRRFRPLFLCQLLSAFGDNLLRNALGVLALWSASAHGEHQGWMVAAAAGAFVAPSILLSGLGGELADRMDKARLIRILKLADLAVAVMAAGGLATGHLGVVFAGLMGSGAVAALFGPVKYGILPDQLGRDRLAAANALVEGATFAAILAGTVGASLLVGRDGGALLVAFAVAGAAALSWASARTIPATVPAAPFLRVRANLAASTVALLRDLGRDRRSWRAALASAWFWMVGAAVLSLLPGLVRDVLGGSAALDGVFLGLFAVGVAGGSGLASFLAGGRIILVTAALGCAVTGVSLLAVWHLAGAGAAAPSWPLFLALFVTAAGAGMLAVPTQAAVQAWARPEHRARAVGGMNVLSALGMALASAMLVVAQRLGVGEPALLGVVGLLCLVLAPVLLLALPRNPLGELAWMVFRLAYRVELHGGANLPRAGQPALLTPNHTSWLDAGLMLAISDEPPLFVIDRGTARLWWVRPALALVPSLRVDSASPYAIRTMVQAVQDGARLVVFPEGRLTVTGWMMEIQEGAATVADKAGAPVVPLRIDGLERTPLSRLTSKQTPRALLPKVTVTVLPPTRLEVPAGLAGRDRRLALGNALRDVMEDMIYRTTPVAMTAFQAVARAARRHGLGRLAVEDPVAGPFTYRRLLGAADVLGRALSVQVPVGGVVGLLLPTSNAAATCLLGLWSWGRVPSMLNFSAGLSSLRSACQAARIGTVVTSRAFVARARLEALVGQLGTEVRVVYLEDIRAAVTPRDRLRVLLRASLAATRPRVPRQPDDWAVVMFTSGSSGAPKGVVMSHANLLQNLAQVGGRIGFGRDDRVLNAMPMFHAIGLADGFLLGVTSGIPVFLYPSPLHYTVIPVVAYGWNATALFGTSTFLDGYARRAKPTAFRSLRLVIAGAERVRPAVRQVWMEKFGLRILEGYGVTECSPVLALNTLVSNKAGTVGRLLPGIEVRLAPVEGIATGGRLSVRGPNVMVGYLRAEAPGVIEPVADGWYDTGDIVSFDADQHLTVLGREERFAKPGGEKVSLAAVEALAGELWPDALSVAVAVADPRKGERIVLLTEQADATRATFVVHARRAGTAEIMLPAEVRVVGKLPLLGSGKPDFKATALLVTAMRAGAEASRDDEAA